MADAMKLLPVEPTEAMINAAGREAFLNGAPEGLTANHVRAAYRAMLAASPPAREEAPGDGAGDFSVDALAQEIRRVDGNHNLGAGALAEALMPFLRARTSEPAREAVACPACLDTWGECNTCGGSHKKDPRWIAAHPAPATADKLKVAKEALEPFAKYPLAVKFDGSVAEDEHQLTGRHGPEGFQAITNGDFVRARQALATLNEEG